MAVACHFKMHLHPIRILFWYNFSKLPNTYSDRFGYLRSKYKHEIWASGFGSAMCKNGIKACWTRLFLIFKAHFCHIWWFLKVEHTERNAKLWEIIKYAKKKNWQKMKKNLAQLALNPFFSADFGYLKLRYPFRH